jgi:hypothetical protein
MKFNSLLIVGASISCFGLLICVAFIPLSSSGTMFQDYTRFLTHLPSQSVRPDFSEGENETISREQILDQLSSDASVNYEPSFSYQQLLHTDRAQYVTPSDSIVSMVPSLLFQNLFNRSDNERIWTDLHTVYQWVRSNIQYRNDTFLSEDGIELTGVDVWQFPNQTILLGTGDCEDQALLLTSLILNYSNTAIYVECLFLQSLKGIGHVAVYLPILGDSICILDPATGYTTSGTTDVLTSQPIEEEISHYLQFLSQLSNDSWRISNVFSDNFSLIFSGAEEFTDWLIERIP